MILIDELFTNEDFTIQPLDITYNYEKDEYTNSNNIIIKKKPCYDSIDIKNHIPKYIYDSFPSADIEKFKINYIQPVDVDLSSFEVWSREQGFWDCKYTLLNGNGLVNYKPKLNDILGGPYNYR